MPLVAKGLPIAALQPDAEVTEDKNGLLSGSAVWDGPRLSVLAAAPVVNVSLHPHDPRLVCSSLQITYSRAGKATASAQFIGLARDPTIPEIDFPGGSGQDPIESHPDFEDFAGTAAAPLNGAQFEEDTGEFLGFFEPGGFQGLRAYIVPSYIVNYTYYTYQRPSPNLIGKIVSNLPNFPRPSNVRDYLRVGMPYSQTGNVYRITDQFLGSGPRGWNRKVYD